MDERIHCFTEFKTNVFVLRFLSLNVLECLTHQVLRVVIALYPKNYTFIRTGKLQNGCDTIPLGWV